MTRICLSKKNQKTKHSKQTKDIIDLDNGLSHIRCQVIICTNTGLLLIRCLGSNTSEIWIYIKKTENCSNKKLNAKIPSAKRWPFCFDLSVLTIISIVISLGVPSTNYFPSYSLRLGAAPCVARLSPAFWFRGHDTRPQLEPKRLWNATDLWCSRTLNQPDITNQAWGCFLDEHASFLRGLY